MKIRIFALAKELGLDSKELIQHCNDAGLDVKSSALASITPEERDVLLAHLKGASEAPAAAPPDAAETTPPRTAAETKASVREIRSLGGGSQRRRPPSAASPFEDKEKAPASEETPVDEAPETESAPSSVEVETAPVSEATPKSESPQTPVEATEQMPAVELSEPATEADSPAAAVAEAPHEDAVETSPAEPAVAEATGGDVGDEVTDAPEGSSADEGDESDEDGDAKRPSPLSRSDYVAPTGSVPQVREMRPRGSIRDMDSRTQQQRGGSGETKAPKREKKKAPSLPTLATPSFKGPSPAARSEGPVQKPDLALTGEMLKTNKLADILRKNRDESSPRRKGGGAADEEEGGNRGRSGSLGLEESRERRRRRRQQTREEEEDRVVVRTGKRQKRSGPIERKTDVTVTMPVTLRGLSEAMGRPARDLLTVLFKQGKMVTINDMIDEETALEIALEFDVDLKIQREQDVEDALTERLERADADFGVPLEHRPPIITVLGHVDHGKTTLVDRIRSSNVVAGEAGGITQHIAAYQVEHNGQKLTFVDTPGHAAFGEMRARGANVTDIVVLLVAADDGVMPQTVECIAHAKAAGVPIVVAMNKVDLPDINEQKVLTDLSQHGLLPSEWGGDVEVCRVSALQGTGVEELLETLLLTAELHELTAPEEIPAEGICLEAFRDEGRGPLAWTLVRRGTLRVGDFVVCGPAYGRVRAMYTDRDIEITEAGPSTPIKLAGLDEVPGAGDHFFVTDEVDMAREAAEARRTRGRAEALSRRGGPKSLDEFFAGRDGGVKDLPLIVKADTPGSIEAIRSELNKFDHDEVRIKILHEGVGGVNESDVYLAASAGAIIIAFHVVAEDRAEELAAQEGVEIRRYSIIYNVTDDIRQALEGLLRPEKVEVATGRALVLRTFPISRIGTVAGCRVLNGAIERTNRVHVIRDQKILNDYAIASLKREKDDAKEVREGYECGIRLEGFNDVKEGDLLEAFRIEERKRSLDE